jgi:hypothetical protein
MPGQALAQTPFVYDLHDTIAPAVIILMLPR